MTKAFCVCGIQSGPEYEPDPRLAWRHQSFCPHSAINADVEPDDLAVVIVRLLRERGVQGVHVRLDWNEATGCVTAIEVRAHLPLSAGMTYNARTYVRIPCSLTTKVSETARALIERSLGGKE